MSTFPEFPSRLRSELDESFFKWFGDLKVFIMNRLGTKGDFTIDTAAKGVVMTNAAGTVTKRMRLNDAGDGVVFEDV